MNVFTLLGGPSQIGHGNQKGFVSNNVTRIHTKTVKAAQGRFMKWKTMPYGIGKRVFQN